ncbi:MAG: hypothetical protein ACD_79C00739G0005 [uncultured bacterium]|nr:MAG: hypothetical protein ACD_79C00739G0005 [uncultured bacterium]
MKNAKLVNSVICFSKSKPILFSLSLMFIALCGLFYSFKSIQPSPVIITRHNFDLIEKDLLDNIKAHGKALDREFLKTTLNSLTSKYKDGWNNTINYNITASDSILLISSGSNRANGNKADIIYRITINS